MKLKYYLQKAKREKWAIGQFNFSTPEILKASVLAAKKMRAPIIVGTSGGESRFLGLNEAVAMVKAQRKIWPLVFLNLDHGKLFDYIKEAINVGYDAVHFDGSKLPIKENIKIAKKVVAYAKKKNVLVEAEMDLVKGSSKIIGQIPEIREEDLTDPEIALLFVQETKVDSLAISIGTFHGVEASGKKPDIKIKRLQEIQKKLKKTFLVLHGGSGVATKDIKKSIKSGIVKININTELRATYTTTLKKILRENPEEIVPYRIMPKVIKNIQKVVEEKIKLFGSANKV